MKAQKQVVVGINVTFPWKQDKHSDNNNDA
jgi:hypothetical protein